MKKILTIFIIFPMLILVSSCKKSNYDYDDFNEIHLDYWGEVDEVITDGIFLVYYYSPFCPDCESIKNDILKAISKRGDRYTVYLMKSMDVANQGTPPTPLRGTPSLFIYENKTFSEVKLGPGEVMNYINQL